MSTFQPSNAAADSTQEVTKVLYTAKTHTSGGRRGGVSRSDDDRLDLKFCAPGLPGTGTNPEQLFAAGWSACFISAMGIVASKMKVKLPADVAVDVSQRCHGLVSQPVFRLGAGVFETLVAILLLISKTAKLGAGLTVVWMTAVILSHIFVLGYGWFFVDALIVMVLALIYLLLTRKRSPWDEPESAGTTAAFQTPNK